MDLSRVKIEGYVEIWMIWTMLTGKCGIGLSLISSSKLVIVLGTSTIFNFFVGICSHNSRMSMWQI